MKLTLNDANGNHFSFEEGFPPLLERIGREVLFIVRRSVGPDEAVEDLMSQIGVTKEEALALSRCMISDYEKTLRRIFDSP